MALINRLVSAVLRSPIRRILSGSVNLVRYTGRRSGSEITTPTQYARRGDDVIILAGRSGTKTWWRNFVDPCDVELLVQGAWMQMRARAVVGADEPEVIAPLLDAYLERFPKAGRVLGEGSTPDRARRAVIVWCQPH